MRSLSGPAPTRLHDADYRAISRARGPEAARARLRRRRPAFRRRTPTDRASVPPTRSPPGRIHGTPGLPRDLTDLKGARTRHDPDGSHDRPGRTPRSAPRPRERAAAGAGEPRHLHRGGRRYGSRPGRLWHLEEWKGAQPSERRIMIGASQTWGRG